MIVLLIDALLHLVGTEIYWHERQLIVWLLLRSTPDGVCFFQLPVAVRHDNVVILQSFTLVDGEESDAVGTVAVDALVVQVGIPFLQEGLNIAAVVSKESVHLVIKCANIGTLGFHILYFSQSELGEETFRQVEQWYL